MGGLSRGLPKALPSLDIGGLWIFTTEIGGKKASKLWIEPSFDWRCVCKPIMPGNPDWCPATHFGIIEQGCMKIERDSGVV